MEYLRDPSLEETGLGSGHRNKDTKGITVSVAWLRTS